MMPIFHFVVQDGSEAVALELPNIAAAKCEAARYAGRLLCDAADTFWGNAEFAMTVTDEIGLVLFSLTMSGIDAPVIAVVQKIPL